jgi:hypothetical protein
MSGKRKFQLLIKDDKFFNFIFGIEMEKSPIFLEMISTTFQLFMLIKKTNNADHEANKMFKVFEFSQGKNFIFPKIKITKVSQLEL